MKTKVIKLSVFEYEQLSRVRKLFIEQGIDAAVCPNCGWKPKNINFSDGGTVGVAMEVFLHFIDNPECFAFIMNKE